MTPKEQRERALDWAVIAGEKGEPIKTTVERAEAFDHFLEGGQS